MGGKLSKQEAKLLKMLMTKAMGEEGMRVMQESGRAPSILQRIVDEASQIGAGVSGVLSGEGFSEPYSAKEAEDRARSAAGQAGRTDAALAGLAAAYDELVEDDRAQSRLVSGATADPGSRFEKAFDQARMTDAEREALRQQRLIDAGRMTEGQLEQRGGGAKDLLTLLEKGNIKGVDERFLKSKAIEEQRRIDREKGIGMRRDY